MDVCNEELYIYLFDKLVCDNTLRDYFINKTTQNGGIEANINIKPDNISLLNEQKQLDKNINNLEKIKPYINILNYIYKNIPNKTINESSIPPRIHYKNNHFLSITPFGTYILDMDKDIIEFKKLIREGTELYDIYEKTIYSFMATYRFTTLSYFFQCWNDPNKQKSIILNLKSHTSKENKFRDKYLKYKQKYIKLKQSV